MRIIIPVLFAGLVLIGPARLPAQSSTLTGASRSFNPALSVNSVIRGQNSRDQAAADLNGFELEGVEVQFSAVVDPFWDAKLILGVHPQHTAEKEDHEPAEHGHSTYVTEPEEAYIESRSLPAGLGLKVGKFALPFGKQAGLHPHQYPFADGFAAVTAFLGDHLLADTGIQATWTVPVPWYADLQAYGVDGGAEPFDAGNRDLVFGGRLVNFLDMTDDVTLEIGGSFLQGPDGRHPGEGTVFRIGGVDLTYKWISPERRGGPAVTIGAEVFIPDYEEPQGSTVGWLGLVQYRFHRNWWLGAGTGMARFKVAYPSYSMDEHGGESTHLREYKLNLTFAPSEFSSVRTEAGYFKDNVTGEDDLRLLVQLNFTIGSHPAHLY